MRRKMMTIALIVLGVLIVGIFIFTRVKQVNPLGWSIHDPVQQSAGFAIGGYDPVAYFNNGTAQEGSEEYQTNWGGANWKFANSVNLDAFKSSPEKYAPQFGGYCAFAVSKGFTAKVDPKAWHIHDDNLYLFADQKVKQDWIAQVEEGVIQKCEKNWN
ncbi:MAG: YHS domain-containing (seleno)protein [Cyclobacteriaceae bacterium]